MKKLKIANTFLAGVLLSTSMAVPAFAQDQENSPVSQMDQGIRISDLVKSTTSNSVSFTDGSKLVQYDNYYIATDTNGNDELKITRIDDNKVKIENLQTGKVDYAIKKVEPIQEELTTRSSVQIQGEGFEYKGAESWSTDIIYTVASAVAGVLASFMGGPVSAPIIGLLTTIGSYYVSMYAKKAYWVEKTYTKEDRQSDSFATLTIRKDYHYYKYYDNTGFIETVSTIQTCMPYGCGTVEKYN